MTIKEKFDLIDPNKNIVSKWILKFILALTLLEIISCLISMIISSQNTLLLAIATACTLVCYAVVLMAAQIILIFKYRSILGKEFIKSFLFGFQ
ncbi:MULTISPECIES: hypothetical protein [unclassified Streptococcus]|uniref:hypothetical protein n=1 Tax=unclassified Streptococcus TaxID=2608887 RepID=UPI001072EB0A|nr:MULTISPECIES: hypothetical protein [unclassified Streptococcus]MBF0786750.1 hypothetical protein [Streptococcus sp. 19428wC2_LYSM12]MCQ9211594.1 hypothetical protein [Streptococcus sp. B01]MCQ9213208.1 hypothetical protein [Streptococcus sp. O1]MCQ9214910.1 hypothetical protein [Streptococcus sp. O1]TFV06498.1 hypothetical protein E4T79_02265 [Streptococcus sp. LYSM12]